MPQGNPAAYFTPEVLSQLLGYQQMQGMSHGLIPGLPREMVDPARMQMHNAGQFDIARLLGQVARGVNMPPAQGGAFPVGDGRVGQPIGVEPGALEYLLGPSFATPSKSIYDALQTQRPLKR